MLTMLTKEQWGDLARFAGITIEEDGVDVNGLPWHWSPELDNHWNPEFDWRDFGPLWVKLRNWVNSDEYVNSSDFTLVHSWHHFCTAKLSESELMQAGCQLGAAIGATMKPALEADKETP
tara:strand:- start:1997 stop:2356 length:360 start_codon:yes stop_codon:yes gene_type:complete